MAFGRNGRVFSVDMSGTVTRLSADGRVETRWELPKHDTGTPSGIFVDRDERVIVPDTHNSRILVYDADGAELARFGRLGTAPGEFIYPNDVVADREGNLYVSEYGGNDRITKFDAGFRYRSSFGGPGDCAVPLAVPYGLSIDERDRIWVADTGNHRLCQFSATGELLQTIGGIGQDAGEFRYPYDVCVLPGDTGSGRIRQESLLVCEKGNNRLQHIRIDGVGLATWGCESRAARGMLRAPTGVAFANERIVVADTGTNRVIALQLESLLGSQELAESTR